MPLKNMEVMRKKKVMGGTEDSTEMRGPEDVPVPPCCQVASKYHSLN